MGQSFLSYESTYWLTSINLVSECYITLTEFHPTSDIDIFILTINNIY